MFHGFLKKCEVFRISAGYNEKERKTKKTETQREERTKKTKQNNKGAQQWTKRTSGEGRGKRKLGNLEKTTVSSNLNSKPST